MGKRVFTTYSKLGAVVKRAIQRAYPDGVEDHLVLLKNVFSGQVFEGLLFDHDDITYMVEWNIRSNYAWDIQDDWDADAPLIDDLDLE